MNTIPESNARVPFNFPVPQPALAPNGEVQSYSNANNGMEVHQIPKPAGTGAPDIMSLPALPIPPVHSDVNVSSLPTVPNVHANVPIPQNQQMQVPNGMFSAQMPGGAPLPQIPGMNVGLAPPLPTMPSSQMAQPPPPGPNGLHKRVRNRKPTASKRKPYNKYEGVNWLELFSKLYHKEVSLRLVATEHNINHRTLGRRYQNWKKQGCLGVLTPANEDTRAQINKERRGGQNKIFDDKEEELLAQWFKEAFIENKLPFNDDDISLAAQMRYRMRIASSRQRNPRAKVPDPKKFRGSHGWVTDFKRKHGLASVDSNMKGGGIAQSSFRSSLFGDPANLQTVKPSLIINVSDVFFRLLSPLLVGYTACSHPELHSKGVPKDGFGVIFTCCSDGTKLPMMVVQNEVHRENARTPLFPGIEESFAPNGDLSGNVMLEWAERILLPYTKGNRCVLILDHEEHHMAEAFTARLRQVNCQVMFVPVGSGYKTRPLDVGISNQVRVSIRSSWKDAMLTTPDNPTVPNLRFSCEKVMHAFHAISGSFIKQCFTRVGFGGNQTPVPLNSLNAIPRPSTVPSNAQAEPAESSLQDFLQQHIFQFGDGLQLSNLQIPPTAILPQIPMTMLAGAPQLQNMGSSNTNDNPNNANNPGNQPQNGETGQQVGAESKTTDNNSTNNEDTTTTAPNLGYTGVNNPLMPLVTPPPTASVSAAHVSVSSSTTQSQSSDVAIGAIDNITPMPDTNQGEAPNSRLINHTVGSFANPSDLQNVQSWTGM
eukprot:TRINITY_DN4834_c0_g1_i1.p1 TRINITY_DN4834_c0_g1~~TRINITY_DN4834_c0_g1_i1.p1  ORF type:complete len:766 (+),score=254.52 TRINITY_DN4834_c0_g1_i1:83-2380(+)